MKALFEKLNLHPLQVSKFRQYFEKHKYASFISYQEIQPIGNEIAKHIANNIDNVFDIKNDTYYFIEIEKKACVGGSATTTELFFKPDMLKLLNNNKLKVISVKFISQNRYQIKKNEKEH